MASRLKFVANLFLGAALLAGPLFAQDENVPRESEPDKDFLDQLKDLKLGPIKMKIGGQIRLRAEKRDDFDFNSSLDDHNGFVLARSRLYWDTDWCEYFRTFVQAQDSRNWRWNYSPRPLIDRLDLQQAYLELRKLPFEQLSIRAGRQDLVYGNGRLVSNSGWHNFGIFTFDAVKVRWSEEDFDIDAFVGNPVSFRDRHFNRSRHDEVFGGLYGTCRALEDHTFDLYFLTRFDRENEVRGEDGDVDDFMIHALGARAQGHLWEPVDYCAEVVHEFGKWGTDDMSAWAAHASAGYTFEVKVKPRIGMHFNLATGDDDPNDGDRETFDNFYPSNAPRYGRMNLLSWRNLVEVGADASVKPIEDLTVSVEYGAFWLEEDRDAWYSVGQAAVRRDPTGSSDSFLGHEVDLMAKYKLSKRLSFFAGYSHFFAADFMDDTGRGDDADWYFFQTCLDF